MKLRSNIRGFSLIELMLALALGLVVTWGIVQLFIGNSKTYSSLNGQSRLQENARYALDFISRSARSSGYFGCAPNVFNTTLNETLENSFEFNIASPIQAFSYGGDGTDTGIGDWAPAAGDMPREAGATTMNAAVDGTGLLFDSTDDGAVLPADMVVFRRVESPERISGDVAPNANPVVEDDGDVDFAVNDFLVISDCKFATVFRATGLAPGAGSITLQRNTGPGLYENRNGIGLGNHFGDVIGLQGTTVGRIVTDIFFVGRGTGRNNRGQQVSSLFRRSGTAAPVELVEGVTDLRVLFGVDTDPTDVSDAPNTYVVMDAVDLDNEAIRTMRIQVTVSSVDVPPDATNVVTRTFVQTINLRNG